MPFVVDADRRQRFLMLCGVFLCLLFSIAAITATTPASDAPLLISEAGSTRALTSPAKANSKGVAQVFRAGTTVTLYLANLDLLPGEGRTAFRSDVEDATGKRHRLDIVSFERSAAIKGAYELTVMLHPEIGDVGDVLVRVTWRGMSSNRVRLSIGHQDNRIKDDEGAVPTPASLLRPIITDPNTSQDPEETLNVGPWAPDRVRFMQQATFGVNAGLESLLTRYTYDQWLAEQMQEKRDSNGDVRYSTFPYPRFPLSVTTPPVDCDGTSGAGNPVDTDPFCFRNRYTMWPLQKWFFREALYGEDQQLRRRISWALSQIFVVGGREIVQSRRMLAYIETLDKHAFGNYRNLLRDITLNPAMGTYLDMAISTNQAPNENYPREILQLFSIGVDLLKPDGTPVLDQRGNRIPSYDQNTVNEFTKVFTGWRLCNSAGCPNAEAGIVNYIDPMVAIAANHDSSQKVLFDNTILPAGQTPEQDLTQALDNIFYHPNVGPFVSKLLIQQLVTSNPTPAYVGRVAAVFSNNGQGIRGDMKSVIRKILLDPEARGNYKTDPDYGHLREPVLFVTNVLRPFDPKANNNALASCAGQSDGILNLTGTLPLDQDVFQPPSVFNYYPMDYTIPTTNLAGPEFGIFSTGTALKRPNFVNFVSPPNAVATNLGGVVVNTNATSVIGGATVANPAYAPCGTRVDFARLQTLMVADPTGGQVVDTLNREMLHGSMSNRMRGDILAAMQAITVSTNTLKKVRTAFYLVATSPHFQVQR